MARLGSLRVRGLGPEAFLAFGLGLVVLVSALALVQVKYLARIDFNALQQVRAERDALEVEWGRLRIEEAALTSHSRVEEKARQELDMHLPADVEVRVLDLGIFGG